MNEEPDISRVANLFADPARAKILRTLMDGTTRPAGELAYAAHISAQSASAHLAKLVDGGLLVAEAQGRHRYFRIASGDVAHAIESLASLSVTAQPRTPRSPLPSKSVPIQFLHARTCYDHLAGETAVKVLEAMLKASRATSLVLVSLSICFLESKADAILLIVLLRLASDAMVLCILKTEGSISIIQSSRPTSLR